MSTTTQDQNALAQGRNFVWHELYTPNTDASIEFYTKCLGFGTQDMDMGPMGTYRMLTRDGQPICGIQGTNNADMKDVPPHWAVYLAVDDVDKRLAECEKAGAKIVVQPMDIQTVGRMALIQDPQGSHIWLFKPAPM